MSHFCQVHHGIVGHRRNAGRRDMHVIEMLVCSACNAFMNLKVYVDCLKLASVFAHACMHLKKKYALHTAYMHADISQHAFH